MWNLHMFFWEIRLTYSWVLLFIIWYKLGFLNAVLKFLVVMDMHRILDLPVTVDNLNFKIKLCSPVKLVQQSANDENISASSESVTDVPQIHRNREGFEANIRAQYTSLEELLSCFWRLYCAVGAVATDSSLPTLVATVDMKGIKVKSPPLELDDRWDSEDIIAISSVSVNFPFFKSLFLYIFSFTELLFVESVEIGRMRLSIEGHRRFRAVASVGTMTDEEPRGSGSMRGSSQQQDRVISIPVGAEEITDFNFQLIGRTRRLRKKQQINSVGVNCALESIGAVATSPTSTAASASSPPSLPQPPASSSNAALTLPQHSRLVVPAVLSSSSPLRGSSLFQLVSKVTTNAIKELESSKRDMDRYLKDRALDLTQLQQKISCTVSDIKAEAASFNSSVQQAGLLQATKQKISEVYVKTKRKLEESVNDKIGSVHRKMNGPEPEQAPGETRLICGTITVMNIDIFMKRALPIQLRHLEQKPLKVSHLRMQDMGLSAVSEAGCCPTSSSCSSIVVASTVPVVAGSAQNRDDAASKEALRELESAWAAEAVRSTYVRTVDVYHAGVDINIIKYRFERLLLISLYHCNAGRLLYDVFQLDQWGQRTPPTATATATTTAAGATGNRTGTAVAHPFMSAEEDGERISEAEGDPDYLIVSSHPFFFDDT